MRPRTARFIVTSFLVLAVIALVSVAGQAQERERETFTGMLAQMTGIAAGATGTLSLTIDRWTTPEERQAYISALADGGQKKLLDLMENARGNSRNGFARFPQTLGWDLTYAWQFMDGATRVVVMATNRPVAFIEARNSYRTLDYPFGFIVLKLNEKGEGEGVVYQAASAKFNKEGVLEIESYGIGPQRLLSIRTKKETVKK
jgi:hypothetical protein